MSDKNAEMLHHAIARNMGAVLSLPSAGMLRHHKSRFLNECDGGFLMEAPSSDAPLIAELVKSASPCGVSFRHNVYKVMFASPVREVRTGYRINAQTVVDALLMQMPAEIKSLQRRADYRVEILAETGASIRVWRIADRAYFKEQPLSTAELATELRNLSVGGAGVRFSGKDGAPAKICSEDRLRVQLSFGDDKLLMEGKIRDTGVSAPDGSLTTGIQFKKLEKDIEGRQIMAQLTRIIGELQRDEARRMRLGLVKAG